MTRVEKAILQEEENQKKEQAKKRNNFIFKIISIIVFFTIIILLIIDGYTNYKEVDGSTSVSEQVGKIVEPPSEKSW
jgi:ABC-type phosphate transport system permease subunit